MKSKKLEYPFFHRECLEVAKDLVGKVLVHNTPEGVRSGAVVGRETMMSMGAN